MNKTVDLHHELREAYSLKNLNNIALTLINLYKNKQFATLRKIADIISESTMVDIKEDGKGFSKFMLLYHPDRRMFHLSEIDSLAADGNLKALQAYAHILLLSDIEELALKLDSFEDIDYTPVYEWDFDTEGYNIVCDFSEPQKTHTKVRCCNFYDAIKKRAFESTDFEYPSYYLEDFDEFELSDSCIDNLDGAEYCIHAKEMDLSDNMIYDLEPLFGLSMMEKLNLSGNKIACIDVLSNLTRLKHLELANNLITDISALLELPKLDYVDLRGNAIDESQLEELIALGIEVEHDMQQTLHASH